MTPLYHPRRERWPQVSLGALFVLVSLLGVSLGWVRVQLNWISDRHAMLWQLTERNEACCLDARTDAKPLPWSIRLCQSCGIPCLKSDCKIIAVDRRRIGYSAYSRKRKLL